jgi:MFS family permease
MAKSIADPVGTLNVGNVVSAGVTLYKSNFKRYFQVSLRSTGWALAIGLSGFALGVVSAIGYGITKSWLLSIPLGLGWIVFSLYCLAKSATNRAIICRLAYQESIDRPETIDVAAQQLQPHTWRFLRLALLLGLYMFAVYIVSYIVLIIALGLAFAITEFALKPIIGSAAYFLLGVLGIGLFCLWILVLIRYYAGWFIAELPMAIEPTKSASLSLRRSRQLSSTTTGRLALVIALAFGITLPISIIGNIPYAIGQFMSNPTISPDRSAQTVGGVLTLVGLIIGALSELVVMPFWQAIKAVIYYDLRNRQEGNDLIL